jgi:ribosome biogenesis GTPase
MSENITVLELLGWDEYFESCLGDLSVELANSNLSPARVIEEHRELFKVWGADGVLSARLSGAYFHRASGRESLPAVGDWVLVEPRPAEGAATIHALIPRRTSIVRRSVDDKTTAQIIAANVDLVLLVSSCWAIG